METRLSGELVFPNGAGKVESLANIINRGLIPAQLAAGVTIDGKAKYTGRSRAEALLCLLVHQPDRGRRLGVAVQDRARARLGHSSITMTYDRYGHLFPRGDDATELDATERALLA